MSHGLISLYYKVRLGIWIHAVILMTLFTSVFSEVWNNLCDQRSYCNRNTVSYPTHLWNPEQFQWWNGTLTLPNLWTIQYSCDNIQYSRSPFIQQRKQNTQEWKYMMSLGLLLNKIQEKRTANYSSFQTYLLTYLHHGAESFLRS